jgi:hypothetical protein
VTALRTSYQAERLQDAGVTVASPRAAAHDEGAEAEP